MTVGVVRAAPGPGQDPNPSLGVPARPALARRQPPPGRPSRSSPPQPGQPSSSLGAAVGPVRDAAAMNAAEITGAVTAAAVGGTKAEDEAGTAAQRAVGRLSNVKIASFRAKGPTGLRAAAPSQQEHSQTAAPLPDPATSRMTDAAARRERGATPHVVQQLLQQQQPLGLAQQLLGQGVRGARPRVASQCFTERSLSSLCERGELNASLPVSMPETDSVPPHGTDVFKIYNFSSGCAFQRPPPPASSALV